MAIEVSFKIDGKMKTFTKDDIYLKDNIRAVKHSMIQHDYYTNEGQTPEKFEEMQDDFCAMISDIFGNEFSPEQLKSGISLSDTEKLNEIYTLALGGKVEEESDGEEESKK